MCSEYAFPRRQIKIPKGIPKQSNSSDCGVFVLLYAHYFLQNAIKHSSSTHKLRSFTRMEYETEDFRKYGIEDGKPWFRTDRARATRLKLIEEIDHHAVLYIEALQSQGSIDLIEDVDSNDKDAEVIPTCSPSTESLPEKLVGGQLKDQIQPETVLEPCSERKKTFPSQEDRVVVV